MPTWWDKIRDGGKRSWAIATNRNTESLELFSAMQGALFGGSLLLIETANLLGFATRQPIAPVFASVMFLTGIARYYLIGSDDIGARKFVAALNTFLWGWSSAAVVIGAGTPWKGVALVVNLLVALRILYVLAGAWWDGEKVRGVPHANTDTTRTLRPGHDWTDIGSHAQRARLARGSQEKGR